MAAMSRTVSIGSLSTGGPKPYADTVAESSPFGDKKSPLCLAVGSKTAEAVSALKAQGVVRICIPKATDCYLVSTATNR
jgi:hypothetical protein